jgi:hypothetical protein
MAAIPSLVQDVERLVVAQLEPSAQLMFALTCRYASRTYLDPKFRGNGALVSLLQDGHLKLIEYYRRHYGGPPIVDPARLLVAMAPFTRPQRRVWSLDSLKIAHELFPNMSSSEAYGNFLFHFGAALTRENYREAGACVVAWAYQCVRGHTLSHEWFDAFFRGLCHADVFSEVYEEYRKYFYYEVDPQLWNFAYQFDALETFHVLRTCTIAVAISGVGTTDSEWADYYILKYCRSWHVGGTRILNFIMKTVLRELEPDTRDELFGKIYSLKFFKRVGRWGNLDVLKYLLDFPYSQFGIERETVESFYTSVYIQCAIFSRDHSILEWLKRNEKIDLDELRCGRLFPMALEFVSKWVQRPRRRSYEVSKEVNIESLCTELRAHEYLKGPIPERISALILRLKLAQLRWEPILDRLLNVTT